MIPARSLTHKIRPVASQAGLTVGDAESIAGTLSAPSKMPGYGYGLPATECKTGAKLRNIEGSTCHGCYALKGNYMFQNVQNSQYNRLDALDNPAWVDALVTLIEARVDPADPYFRWHDSGDIQSVDHLHLIAEVCRQTPWVHHWLPTREYAIVCDYRDAGSVPLPPNLTIRLSAHMVDGKAPEGYGLPVSGVFTQWDAYQAANPAAQRCPAPTQGNECADCRACWQADVMHVTYHKH